PMSYIYQSHPHPAPHSFPTRRSSDLFSQGSTSGSSEPNEGARGTAGIPESGLGLGVPSKEPESIGAGTMEDPDRAGIAGVDKAGAGVEDLPATPLGAMPAADSSTFCAASREG